MIQYYSVNMNMPQTNLVCETRKVTVEIVSKYVTKGHIAMYLKFKVICLLLAP